MNTTKFADLVRANRSCRRFYEDDAVALETLKELVNLGRLSASGANLQPLKYILSTDSKKNADIFSCLAWAGYLKDWAGPGAGERPAAYKDNLLTPALYGDRLVELQTKMIGPDTSRKFEQSIRLSADPGNNT